MFSSRATSEPVDERGARVRCWTERAYGEQADAAFCAMKLRSWFYWVVRTFPAVFLMKWVVGSIVNFLSMTAVLRAVSNFSEWRAPCKSVVAMAKRFPFFNTADKIEFGSTIDVVYGFVLLLGRNVAQLLLEVGHDILHLGLEVGHRPDLDVLKREVCRVFFESV